MTESSAPGPLASRLVAGNRDALLQTIDEVVRVCGFTHPDGLEGLRRGALGSHDELAGLRDRRGFENARGLTASRISLVHDEDLEFTIRINEFARRLRERCDRELGRLHGRYMTLLDQSDDASVEQLPVGPETVCCGLREMSDAAGFDPAMRLQMLERIESSLAQALNLFYGRLNKELEAAGVEPQSLSRPATPTSPPAQQAPRSDANDWGSGSFGELHRATVSRLGGGTGAVIDATLAAAVREQVLAWLDNQQHNLAIGSEVAALGASHLGPLLGPRERAAADALENVFRAIEQDRQLAAPIRAALGSLALPMLKLALIDPTVLEAPDHVARRLINAIGDCCRGLSVSAGADHPLCVLIKTLTDGVVLKFGRDPEVFAQALASAQTIAADRTALAIQLATTSNTLAAKVEREEVSLKFAAKAIRALSSDGVPTAVRGFLDQHWVRVLQNTLLTHGEKSPEWRNQLTVADRLIWSVQPKPTADERQQLLRTLPELLRHAAEGLAGIGIDEAHARECLAPCMTYHTAAINAQPMPAELPYAPPQPVLEFGTVGAAPGLKVFRLVGVIGRESVLPPALATLKPGQWIEFGLHDNRRVRACVGWIGPARQTIVVCDPDRRGVMGVTMRALEREFSTGDAWLINEAPLFETAAAHVLKGLRSRNQ
ncbi:DUF1631 domain-containing protein [Niveibacterium sp. 24ML]|uniref:DUF1631 family protein n=1 Tax=Niveibacterium sp. 24ML TaxID=2985512 RepID=UPI002270E549|nr:DUF1631 family protein [Niveibacterium sp. 24ML]MCX9155216.1 DUF1631 domain-containing protein [Niveibacterium sp. 24ML]